MSKINTIIRNIKDKRDKLRILMNNIIFNRQPKGSIMIINRIIKSKIKSRRRIRIKSDSIKILFMFY